MRPLVQPVLKRGVRKKRLDEPDSKSGSKGAELAGQEVKRADNRVPPMVVSLRQLFLVVALIVLYAMMRTDPPVEPQSFSRTVLTQPVVQMEPPNTIAVPSPAIQLSPGFELESVLPPATTSPASAVAPAPADATEPEPPTMPPITDENAVVLTRYLGREARPENSLSLFASQLRGEDDADSTPKLRVGYGRIFRDDSVISRGRNGTGWEEPSLLYLKATFRF